MIKLLFLPGTYTGPAASFRYFQLKNSFKKNDILCHNIVLFPKRTFSANSKIITKLSTIVRTIHALVLIPFLSRYDAVISIRDIVPNNKIFFLERLFLLFSKKFITDFDDTFFDGSRQNKAIYVLKNSSKVIVGNNYLANFAGQYNSNVYVIPTVIDTDLFKPIKSDYSTSIQNKIPIIVWTGSKGTRERHLPLIYPILEVLSKKKQFKFRVIADSNPFDNLCLSYETEFIKWDADNPINGLPDSTVGIMPLIKEKFELGKCGFKLIQYGAVGLPSIATNWGVNNEIIIDGVNGFLCETDDDWIEKLSTLLNDPNLCKVQGKKARQRVVEYYSVDVAVEKWIEVLK